ncbi:hypothetical protein ACWDR0_33535 [Streptomyces sp. NPDC003691]
MTEVPERAPGAVLRVALAADRWLMRPWGLMALVAVLLTLGTVVDWPLGPVVAGLLMAAVFAVGFAGKRYERRGTARPEESG